MSSESSGNKMAWLMYLYTQTELHKMHVKNEKPVSRIVPEQSVLIEKRSRKREGRYDFFVETEKGKTLGIEVLTRPTQGKMKEKLAYAKNVDEFVFVVPHNSLNFYRKPKAEPIKRTVRLKSLGREFSSPKLSAWLFDPRKGIVEKGSFSKLFNVERR